MLPLIDCQLSGCWMSTHYIGTIQNVLLKVAQDEAAEEEGGIN